MQQSHLQTKEQLQTTLLDQFKQQMLKAWQPVPTLTKTIVMFFILAVIFLGLGIPMLILSTNILQYNMRYDDVCTNYNTTCDVVFQVPLKMTGPVFVYYELRNFYQNHRLYAKSLSSDQLKGNTPSNSNLKSDCDPIIYNKDLFVSNAIDGTPLDPNGFANPCGMIAYTLFNDTFSLGSAVSISETGIAWPSDESKFKISNRSQMWTDTTSQRFMNWMRIAAMPTFRKLWGRIQTDLEKGNYTLTIQNYYDISSFQGEKYFVVSQSNFFGSKNQFLSITYIVVGGLCLVIAIAFLVKKLLKKKKIE